MSFSRWILSALIVGALLACGPAPAGHTPAAGQSVSVGVEPTSAQVQVGSTAHFAATVTGTADTGVVWQVVETGGGAVDATGRYPAPGTPGVFHVRASSRATPTAQADGTVTVVAPVAVTVSPRTPSVVAGGTIAFSATVQNATNTAVDWSVSGTGCGTITTAGLYTAPAAAASCTVVATSQQDPSRSDAATVTVTAPPPPIVVTITPATGAADACRTATFSATVTGTSNTAVTWSVQEGVAGGTISSTGVYTAPSVAGTYHVVATSAASPASSANVPVVVADRVLSVVVSPQTIQVPPGGTAQFTATVTTTCGAVVATSTIDSAGQILR